MLDGEMMATSDLDFVIDDVRSLSPSFPLPPPVTALTPPTPQNMVHIYESTVGRRFAGWFIRNTEHAQRVLDGLRASPLPIRPKRAPGAEGGAGGEAAASAPAAQKKVAWGGAKV